MNTMNAHTISAAARKYALVLFTILLMSAGSAATGFSEEHDSLAELIGTALQSNSDILAARSKVVAAREKIRQAGSLPDPRVGVDYYLQPIETRTGPQEASLSLQQTVPWPAKLSLDKELKEAEAAIDETMLNSAALGVIRKVKEAYVEHGYLGQAHRITGEILELMNYLEGVARTNYSSGKTSFDDVLKLQVEIAKLKNRRVSLADKEIPVRAGILSLVGADNDALGTLRTTLPDISLNLQDAEIHELSKQNNPKIIAGRHGLDRGRTQLEIADLGFYPDFTVSVRTIFTGEAEYGNPPDSGTDPIIAGFSVNLPLSFDRVQGAVAEKQASLGAARNSLEQTGQSLAAEIELNLFLYRDAERLHILYRDELIPEVRRQLDVALEAFQSGHHTILELIDAEKNCLDFELAKLRAQADKAIQIARLEELAGATLADWGQEN